MTEDLNLLDYFGAEIPREGVTALVGVTREYRYATRDLRMKFARWDANALGEALVTNARLTRRLEEAIRERFAKHNQTGYTLTTLKVSNHGLESTITIGGGAPFIYWGAAEHDEPSFAGGGVMRFKWGGEDIFRSHVHHPGVKADKFIDEAIEEVKFKEELQRLVVQATAKTFGTQSWVGKLEE